MSILRTLTRKFSNLNNNLSNPIYTQVFKSFDNSQINQLNDLITQVDENDNVIGAITKLDGHLLDHESQKSRLHRAFSFLLFNNKNQLLLQQRSHKKITFPLRWTNTCCSHNSHSERELESEPDFIGMRRAAIRRTQFEMGINDITENEVKVVSRILYYAPSCDKFAEHELDYIIFARKDIGNFEVNPDEIDDYTWVGIDEIDDFFKEQEKKLGSKEVITPWFKILKEEKLMKWWKDLIENGKYPDESQNIHKFV